MLANIIRKRLFALALLTLFTGSIVACSSFEFPGVYRVEVEQGNVFDQETIDKLELGMTRSQVRFVLGTPLIQDPFNPDRWDYTYQVQVGAEVSDIKRMVLYFSGDELIKIDQDLPISEDASESTASR